MGKIKSILLLFVLLSSIAPWGLLDICSNHPEGHEEQSHHGSCENGMMDSSRPDEKDDKNSQLSFEATPCSGLDPATDAYNTTIKITPPTADQSVVIAVLLNILKSDVPEQKFYPQPDPQSNSDPPLGVNALRGPPLV